MATAFAYRSKESNVSDSDSEDSDKECLNWKRVTKNEDESIEKIPMVPHQVEPCPVLTTNPSLKRKRNTIWCEVLEDQMMSETLNHCGIKNKPKGYGERGEESYDFTLKRHYKQEEKSDNEMSDKSLSSLSSQPYKRFKNDKFVKLDPDGVKAANEILRKLSEQKKYLIFRVVKYLGIEKAMKIMKMTEDIEDSGGMMIKSMERRRTPGGVYLHLVRTDKTIEQSIMDQIFEGEFNSYERKKKFAEIRKKKKYHKKKPRKAIKHTKDLMECQPASPKNANGDSETKKDSEWEDMEEDDDNNENSNAHSNDKTSDLEEGEVD